MPIRSVTHYAAVLRTLNKDVSLFIDAEGMHTLPSPLTREAYLYLMEDMLHRHLGGMRPKPPSPELLAHLRKNLRVAPAMKSLATRGQSKALAGAVL